MTTISQQLQFAAADFRRVRPTAADQRNNPDVDVHALWLDDIEHTISCKELDAATAAEFRAACGA